MLLRQIYRTSIDGYIRKHKLSCGLQSAASPIASTRVKRRANTQSRQKQSAIGIEITQNCAKMREGVSVFTAKLPQGDL